MAITLNGSTGITTADIAATTLTVNAGFGSNATAYGCRAWVNFNGTGTVAIRDSGNVSSITDNATGNYTFNFSTAMPDINYNVVCGTSPSGSRATHQIQLFSAASWATQAPTTSAFRFLTPIDLTSLTDIEYVCLSVFR